MIIERENTLMALIDESEKQVNEPKEQSEMPIQTAFREAFSVL